MKIMHLISSRGYFGAENMAVTLAKKQAVLGADVCLGVFRDRRCPHIEAAEKAAKIGIKTRIFDCRGRMDFLTLKEIRKFLKANEINILHSHGYKADFYSVFLKIFSPVKTVVTCHNWCDQSLRLRIYKKIDMIMLKNFDRIISVSESVYNEIVSGGVSKKKVVVINNGVEIDKFDNPDLIVRISEIKKSLGIKSKEKIVGTVGRLSREKGHVILLRAAGKIVAEMPEIKFMIVGDGMLRNMLEAERSRLKLDDNVIFTGIRGDVPALLQVMDIFVLPSLDEGLPVALLEAMAAKKPVVAANVGGVTEVVEDGYTGILIEAGNENELIHSIFSVLKTPEKAAFMGMNGYKKILSEFSSERMARRYMRVYREILNKRI